MAHSKLFIQLSLWKWFSKPSSNALNWSMFDEVSLRLIINGKVVIRKSFKNVINMKIKLNHFEF